MISEVLDWCCVAAAVWNVNLVLPISRSVNRVKEASLVICKEANLVIC